MTLILPEWLMWFFAVWIVFRIIDTCLVIFGHYLDAEFKKKLNELPEAQKEALKKNKESMEAFKKRMEES